ncbi:MAG: hypothetical protein JWM05_545 [Acidimicrobiales bacterium]|nr:hypothetical protein [Acidimicrobiales bacterium]
MVALGGGHGLAATLRAVRRYAGSITAVVSVADDGGSSGRLRADMHGMPAPGDLRRCLSALAAPDSVLGGALEYRFGAGDLDGHALGNLLIAGLADHLGDFVASLDQVGALVGAVGRVLPAAAEPVTLTARVDGGGAAEGQVAVQNATGIARVTLRPESPAVDAAVLDALMAADQVVMGPGSLFTSVLAAVVAPAIREALCRTAAQRIYVCNLGAEPPETAGFSAADHVGALLDHGIPVDVVVCPPGALRADQVPAVARLERPVADDRGLAHDPRRLAAALVELCGAGPDRPSVLDG